MKSILELLTLQSVLECEVKKAHPNKAVERQLIVIPDHNVAVTKTFQGEKHYPCVKVTFWNNHIVPEFKTNLDELYLRIFIAAPYMLFIISNKDSTHGRKLTFQESKSYDSFLCRGTLSAKIATTSLPKQEDSLDAFIGQYNLQKTNIESCTFYYINMMDKCPNKANYAGKGSGK